MLSKHIQIIQPSATLAISAKAKALIAEGKDVLNFSAGEPDFAPAGHILEAAQQAVAVNDSYYSPTAGLSELRAAIAETTSEKHQQAFSADDVVVTNGGKEALFLLFQAILNEGDEVIVPTPFWVSYADQIRYAGGKPVFVNSDEAFHVWPEDIDEALSKKTKAIIVNSPSNPTGALMPEKTLAYIAKVAKEKDLVIVSDDVYEEFAYEQARPHILQFEDMKPLTVLINSVSKTYCMTGWRVGFAIGHHAIIEGMVKLKSHLSSNVNNIAQRAALAALAGPQDAVAQMRAEFQERRDLLWEGVNAIEGLSLAKPEGAFYGFINFASVMKARKIKNSFKLCEQLLVEQLVALVPGEAFGEHYSTYARFSFASSKSDIKKALVRLEQFSS